MAHGLLSPQVVGVIGHHIEGVVSSEVVEQRAEQFAVAVAEVAHLNQPKRFLKFRQRGDDVAHAPERVRLEVEGVQRGEPAEAKQTLQRAVDVLPQAKHVEVLSKFAQLEFKHGAPERGRTAFDGVLASFPKRVDVWSVFLDMELKAAKEAGADQDAVRRLFERVITLRLSSKKVKFFFSRYLKYAREVEDDELVAHVQARAREWVEGATA